MANLKLASRALNKQFVQFCMIGVVGFATDAAIMMVLIRWWMLPALAARLASFAVAVVVTFELNRRWTFRNASARTYLSNLAAYVGTQGLGFACNLLVYSTLYFALKPAESAPLVALAVASAAALFVNYFGARIFVFRQGRRPAGD